MGVTPWSSTQGAPTPLHTLNTTWLSVEEDEEEEEWSKKNNKRWLDCRVGDVALPNPDLSCDTNKQVEASSGGTVFSFLAPLVVVMWIYSVPLLSSPSFFTLKCKF